MYQNLLENNLLIVAPLVMVELVLDELVWDCSLLVEGAFAVHDWKVSVVVVPGLDNLEAFVVFEKGRELGLGGSFVGRGGDCVVEFVDCV